MADTTRLARSCIALVAALAVAPALAEEARHTLRYRFTPGETVYFTVQNETTRRYQQSAAEILTRDSTNSLKHYRVLSVQPDGSAVLELVIDRTKMQAEQDNILHSYDSTKDKTPPPAFEAVHATIGRPWLHVTVSPVGETTNFQTPSGIKVPESTDFVSRVVPVLPEQPVAIGDRWKEPFTVDVPTADIEVREGQPLTRPIKLQRVYELKSVKDGIASIDFRTEVLTATRTPKDEVALVQRKFSGTIEVDITNGRLLGRDLKADGHVVGYDGPMSAMHVKMSQRDAYAPAGAETPSPAIETAAAGASDAPSE